MKREEILLLQTLIQKHHDIGKVQMVSHLEIPKDGHINRRTTAIQNHLVLQNQEAMIHLQGQVLVTAIGRLQEAIRLQGQILATITTLREVVPLQNLTILPQEGVPILLTEVAEVQEVQVEEGNN